MSELKKYIARTIVSVGVILPNKKSRRVSFMPNTAGGSYFLTDDEDIQSGLENHYKFGTMFKLDPRFKAPSHAPKGAGTRKKANANIGKGSGTADIRQTAIRNFGSTSTYTGQQALHGVGIPLRDRETHGGIEIADTVKPLEPDSEGSDSFGENSGEDFENQEVLFEEVSEETEISSEETFEESEDAFEETEDAFEEPEEPQMLEVNVTDIAKAKDYLAERFGVVRTKLKSKKIIDETAAIYKIKFVYA